MWSSTWNPGCYLSCSLKFHVRDFRTIYFSSYRNHGIMRWIWVEPSLVCCGGRGFGLCRQILTTLNISTEQVQGLTVEVLIGFEGTGGSSLGGPELGRAIWAHLLRGTPYTGAYSAESQEEDAPETRWNPPWHQSIFDGNGIFNDFFRHMFCQKIFFEKWCNSL